MFRPRPAHAGLAAWTAAAVAGGVLIASGLDWTAGSEAASLHRQAALAAPAETVPARSPAAAPSRAATAPVADLSDAFISIAESVTPAVVAIETRRADDGRRRRLFQFPDDHPPMPDPGSSGSGFFIRPDGYVVTNNHVVEGADEITVILDDNRHLSARLVGRDPNTDVAVIRVPGDGFPVVRTGRSEDARIGEWVLAIGNPLDLGTTVTSGIVSAKGRALDGLLQRANGGSAWTIEDFIQTDAPINPGNSGGPLVNLRGEVVGVNSAIASPTGFYSGYGFAVPIDLAGRVAQDLIEHGRVRRPALGVQVTEVTPEDAEVFGLSRIAGVVAQDFPGGSPARDAGLRQGDVVVAVDGRPVERVGQFQRLIATHRPGDRVRIDVVRYGEARSFVVELGEAPAPATPPRRERRVDVAEPRPAGPLGITVVPLTAARADSLGFDRGGGLAISDVARQGAADRAGVRPGVRVLRVDGRAVETAREFQRLLDGREAGDVVSLVLGFPGGGTGIVNVRLPAAR